MSDVKRDDGGAAFGHGDRVNGGSEGMSLRDWFAGQALIAIADDCGMTDKEIAKRCYQRADAMIAARK